MPETATYLEELAKNYERLTEEDLNDEGVCMLMEAVHDSLNGEMRDLVAVLEENRRKVRSTERYAETGYMDVLKKYEELCKNGILGFKVRRPGSPVTERTRSRIANNAAKSIENHYNLKKSEVKYVITLHNIKKMKQLLSSKYYDAIALGHGKDMLSTFSSMIDGNAPVRKTVKKRRAVDISHKGDPSDVRERMRKWREANDLSYHEIAEKIGIGEQLLRMVEEGEVTHPKICKKIQKVYGLTDEETKQLMPAIHREGTPEYEPDKFKLPEDYFRKSNMVVIPTAVLDWDGYRR